MYDLIIHNGTLLTVNPHFDIVDNGVLAVEGDRIALVSSCQELARLPEAETVMDAAGGLIMPGLVNAHTHLPMTLFRGLADDLPLAAWLNEHIFPAETRHINPETVRCGALLACAELLLAGTTTCCDGYFYEDTVAEAIAQSGLRAVVGQGVIDFPAPGAPDPSVNVTLAEGFVNKWQGRCANLVPSIFCHSPYTCSEATLLAAKKRANDAGVLFQIHVAETRAERQQSLQQHGLPPVMYLEQLGLLDLNTLLIHAVWVDAQERGLIARQGAKVVHNPESNMKLAAGIAPVPELLKMGVAVGLGTDGCASNNDLDLFGEMGACARLHKVSAHDPTVMAARQVVEMATIGGARALGLDHLIGSLEVGKQADVIVLDTQAAHLTPLYHPASHLVYAAGGADVRDVVVGGRQLCRARRLLTLDVGGLMQEAAAIAAAILPDG